MNIKYKNTIVLQKNKDAWYLETDRGDRYECYAINNTFTPWTRWWEMQHQSELRSWQKDIIRDFASKWYDLAPFMVYKRNNGHSQPHDISLAHSEKHKVWILSTEDDFWFVPCDYGVVNFTKEHSMGSILQQANRFEMGALRDALIGD